MSFLAPLFLLGAVAVGLPVLFHLIRRSSRERTPFSSLMFLLPTPPRVTRRSKLENVLLLILRCLVVCLLAFAFARPFFSKPVAPDPSGQAGRKLLLLLDTSASMRRGSLWNQAKDKAAAVLRSVGPADQVACISFDRELHNIVSFDQWSALPLGDRAALVLQRLNQTTPGWGSTRLGNALISACEMFESSAKDEQISRRIFLISDLQEGARLDGLQGFEWPRGIEVTIESLTPPRSSNAGLQLALEREDAQPAAGPAPLRVRINNAADSRREQFQIGWRRPGGQGFAGATLDVYVPPGQSRVIAVPAAETQPSPDRLALAGDEEEFDNLLYVVPPKAEKARILYLGSTDEKNSAAPLYYIQRAFQQTRKLAVEVIARDPGTPLTDQDLAGARLLIIADALPEEQITAVRNFLRTNKAVLIPLGNVAMVGTLAKVLGVGNLPVEEAADGSYAMLGQIDFEHPLFSPFSDPRYSDFTKIHFWKHRRVALDKVPGSRILARFDDNDPALAQIGAGQSTVWVWTSGWRPEDSQFVLSSKFVPLLYSVLEQSGTVRDERVQYLVGDAVPLAVGTEAVTVRKPDGSETKTTGGEKFTGTDLPGIYTVTSVQPPLTFAVNLAPEESRTAPLPLEELERLGLPLQHQVTGSPQQLRQRQEHLQAAQLENRQKLWRWLIVTALVVLVVETWLAGRLTRRAVTATPETANP